jgi:hypothetical protein
MHANQLPPLASGSTCISIALRPVGFILLLALTSACAPVSPTASEDRALFESLCNASDRNWLKREVFVQGYAHAQAFEDKNSCLDARDTILFEGYSYHECVQGAWNGGENKNITTYKYSLKPEGHISCGDRRFELLGKTRVELLDKWLLGLQTRKGEFLGQCIGIEQYDVPVSQYVKLIDSGHVSTDGTHIPSRPPNFRETAGYISYVRTRIMDRQSNSFIFENRYYSYYPMSPKYSGSRHGKLTCNGLPDLKDSDVLHAVESQN